MKQQPNTKHHGGFSAWAIFVLAWAIGLTVACDSLFAASAGTGSYQIGFQLAPYCLDGTFPLTMQTASGPQAGTITLSPDAKGALTGQLVVGGQTLAVRGKVKFAGSTGRLTLLASGGSGKVSLKGSLAGTSFKGAAKGNFPDGVRDFTLDLSTAKPFKVVADFNLTVDSKGKGTGTGTAKGCGLQIPVNIKASVDGQSVKLTMAGSGLKLTGTGTLQDNTLFLSVKVKGGGATTTTTATKEVNAPGGVTITTSASPANGGSTSGDGSYTNGSSVTVVATASTGYSFVNWMEGSSMVSTSATYTFLASANRTLVASFTSTNLVDLIRQARAKLENADAPGADALFRQALAAEPLNRDANFGTALTSLILLVEDPAVTNMVGRFGQKPIRTADIFAILARTNSLTNFFGAVPPLPYPQPSEIQAVLTTNVLPRVSQAISLLRYVEGQGYTFEVTTGMVDNASVTNSIFLDDGEFYAADSMLSQVSAAINILSAYNLDFDQSIIDADPLSIINGPDGVPTTLSSNFFTLKSDGPAKLQAAHTLIRDALAKGSLGYSFAYSNDVDVATDGGLRIPLHDYDHNGVIDSNDLVFANTYVDYVFGLLQDSFVSLTNVCLSVRSNCVNLVASRFLTNPVDRSDLPRLGYDLPRDPVLSATMGRPIHQGIGWTGSNYDSFVSCKVQPLTQLPDPSINGVFPDGVWAIPGQPRDGLLTFASAIGWTNDFSDLPVTTAAQPAYLLTTTQYFAGTQTNRYWNGTTWVNYISNVYKTALQQVNPLNGSTVGASVHTDLDRIWSLAVLQGRTFATGWQQLSPTNSLNGLFELNSGGAIVNYIDTYRNFDMDIYNISSDGRTLWGDIESGSKTTNYVYGVASINPNTGQPGAVVFTPYDPQFTGRFFAGEYIDGLTSDGSNLYVQFGKKIVKIAPNGTVLSEKKSLGLGTPIYWNGNLQGVAAYRFLKFNP